MSVAPQNDSINASDRSSGLSQPRARLSSAGRFTAIAAELSGRWQIPLLVVALALIVHFALSRMRLGRYCYAMGSNIEAARYAGINVWRYQIAYYTILGALSGLAGAIETSRTVTGQPNAGEGYELNVIAAVVIGGGSLSGGQGTVVGTIIGSLIMGVLANGGNLLQISPFIQKIVIGAVIVLAVTFDEFQRRRMENIEG